MISISAELTKNKHVITFLREMPEMFPEAIADAANKAAKRVTPEARKLLKKYWNAAKGAANEEWKTTKAKADDPTATVSVSSGMTPFYNMGAAPQSVMSGKTSGGVSVFIGENRHVFKHAFVAQTASGHKGVFERTGKTRIINSGRGKGKRREAVKELYTISIPQMTEDVTKMRITPVLAKQAQEAFENAFIESCDGFLRASGLNP